MVSFSGVKPMYQSYIAPISRLQRKAVKVISFEPHMAPLLPKFKDLKLSNFLIIVNLGPQILYLTLSTRHQLLAFMASSYLVHLFINIPQERLVMEIYTRLKKKPSICLKSLHYLCAKLWNSLSAELTNAQLEQSFEINLKMYLLNKVY